LLQRTHHTSKTDKELKDVVAVLEFALKNGRERFAALVDFFYDVFSANSGSTQYMMRDLVNIIVEYTYGGSSRRAR